MKAGKRKDPVNVMKKSPVGKPRDLFLSQRYLHRYLCRCRIRLAGEALVEHPQRGKAYQDIHDGFYCWPRAKQEVYHIQIVIGEKTNALKTPVDTADNQQNLRYPRNGTHLHASHRKTSKKYNLSLV